MPALQTCFLMPQITETMKKWPQSCANRPPKIHQKSIEINIGTFKGTPDCTLAPNDHQNRAKVVPQDPRMPPKWCPKSIKSVIVNAKHSEINSQWFQSVSGHMFEKIFKCWKSSVIQSCRSCKSCKSIRITDFKSADCQRGRRQGRSLKINICD